MNHRRISTYKHQKHDPPSHRGLPRGWIGRPGGHGGGPAPDPIPNSAVKTPSAHGTVPPGTGEEGAARSSNPPTPRPKAGDQPLNAARTQRSKRHNTTLSIPPRGGAAR